LSRAIYATARRFAAAALLTMFAIAILPAAALFDMPLMPPCRCYLRRYATRCCYAPFSLLIIAAGDTPVRRHAAAACCYFATPYGAP